MQRSFANVASLPLSIVLCLVSCPSGLVYGIEVLVFQYETGAKVFLSHYWILGQFLRFALEEYTSLEEQV